MSLLTPIEKISGVGPIYIKRLKKIGIKNISDLLFYFPRRYDDFSNIIPISKARFGEMVTVKGQILAIGNHRTKRGMIVTEVILTDGTDSIPVVWFNQPFMIKNLKIGDKVVLAGKLEFNYGKRALQNPAYEKISQNPKGGQVLKHVGRIVPVYPETEGVSSRWLRYKIQPLLKYVYNIKDYLPEKIKRDRSLIGLQAAIRAIHFPENDLDLEQAKKRIAFDELFLLQLKVLAKKIEYQKEKSELIKFQESLSKKFVQSLPFKLTESQRKAAWEIIQDIGKDVPMNRLLEGDVGSGKTVVACFAMFLAAKSSFQSALMCPTEILAKQHYQRVGEILKPFEIKIALLVGSLKKKEKENILGKIKDGETQVVIGTHALIQEGVGFKKLALCVIDEQHRFGVEQRKKLKEISGDKTTGPHFLSMTATPIPRTLTLTLYGDLDVSILDEMPPGRQPVITRLAPKEKREAAYGFIRKKVKEGRQVFVICPLIEALRQAQGKALRPIQLVQGRQAQDKVEQGVIREEEWEFEKRAVTSEYKKLSEKIFPDLNIGMLHGKMKSEEKEKVMADFSAQKIDILVSTSVVEVGIDISNATIIMIENAEKFGLTQLHQFRGRVGRGEYQSYCILFTEVSDEVSLKRLFALVKLQSGFKLAEIDLEIRGPGEVYGTRQHGLPEFKVADLFNLHLIKEAREEAYKLLKEDPSLEKHPLLKEKVKEYDVVMGID